MWLEREVKPKIVVVGVHNQTETLGRRVVPSKNCVMKNHRGSAGEWPAGKGKKLTHPTMCQAETLLKLTLKFITTL